MIKNIVFDFGGVLVQYDFTAYFTGILGSKEKGKWFMENVLNDDNNDLLDKGGRPFEEYIAEWKQRWPDYAVALDAFDKHNADIFTGEVPGMYDLMIELKSKGYRLLGLSNWHTKVFGIMRKFPRIFSLLDGYLISHQVHMIKPHRDIFEAFLKKFDVTPGECVFVDDKQKNIDGAKSVGMCGILFKNAGQLKADLEKLLTQNDIMQCTGL